MRKNRLAVSAALTLFAIGVGSIFLTQQSTVTAAEEYGVRFHRTLLIADGKAAEARAFALETVSYINEQYPGSNVKVYMESFGQLNRIHWFSDEKDVAALEQRSRKMASDQKWQAILAKAVGLFVEGSGKDTLYTLMR